MNNDASLIEGNDGPRRNWAPQATVAVVLLVAMTAASGSVWFRLRANRRPVEFLGHDQAQRLLIAPQARLIRSEVGESDAATASWPLASAPGFSHVRRSLLSDRSYVWNAPVDAAGATWIWSITVGDASGSLSLDFDLERGLMRVGDDGRVVSIAPATAALEKFFSDVAQTTASDESRQ